MGSPVKGITSSFITFTKDTWHGLPKVNCKKARTEAEKVPRRRLWEESRPGEWCGPMS